MKETKITEQTLDNAENNGRVVVKGPGLSDKDIAMFERKMANLTTYLCDLAKKGNHSDEVMCMIQNGLMEVMDWFIPIR